MNKILCVSVLVDSNYYYYEYFPVRDPPQLFLLVRRMRSKEVQIIPWVIGDSNYVRCPSQRLDPQVSGQWPCTQRCQIRNFALILTRLFKPAPSSGLGFQSN